MSCVVWVIDGERVRLSLTVPEEDLTPEDRDGLVEIVRAAKRKFERENNDD